MFMRENRRKNGAPQPEQTAASDAADQRSARVLVPNGDMPAPPASPVFMPTIQASSKTNEQHYQGGLSGDPFTSYESHIPSVGNALQGAEGDRALKGR